MLIWGQPSHEFLPWGQARGMVLIWGTS
jgi:hypothetical protein